MTSYHPTSIVLIERAKRGEKPYSITPGSNGGSNGLTIVSFVRDESYDIKDVVGASGHMCWHCINPSTTRPRKVRLDSAPDQKKVFWTRNGIKVEKISIEVTLRRTRETDIYFAYRDCSEEFQTIEQGEECVITKCHFCPDPLESGFVIRHSHERKREGSPEPSITVPPAQPNPPSPAPHRATVGSPPDTQGKPSSGGSAEGSVVADGADYGQGDDTVQTRPWEGFKIKTGEERQRVHEALMSHCSTLPELERFASFTLNVNLQSVTSDTDLPTAAFKLIKWAETRGKLAVLLTELPAHLLRLPPHSTGR